MPGPREGVPSRGSLRGLLEASQEEASRWQPPPREKEGVGHLRSPGTPAVAPGWVFLSAVRNLWGVCGELCCSMGWCLHLAYDLCLWPPSGFPPCWFLLVPGQF